MQVDFFDANPLQRFRETLIAAMDGAQRIDAAIAFVTGQGYVPFRDFIASHPTTPIRLVVSVRYPTNLDALARFDTEFPGRLYIHTGYYEPHEQNAERGQLHSKLVLIERNETDRCIVIGSHNWTQNALEGHNLEGSAILQCQEEDSIVADVRQHIEACIQCSERFDQSRLRFYETVQRKFHTGPGRAESEAFPGFEEFDALVIHAEADDPDSLPDVLRLFIPVRYATAYPFFQNDPIVMLHVYSKGALFDRTPDEMPLIYEGQVTLSNTVSDAPVARREANSEIRDLDHPRISLLSEGNLPPVQNERWQVAIHLNGRGRQPTSVYHAGSTAPRMRLQVETRDVRESPRPGAQVPVELDRPEGQHGSATPPLRYVVPINLRVNATVELPSEDLYPPTVAALLRRVLWGDEFLSESDIPEITLKEPRTATVLNRYVYRVHHHLNQETLDRIQRQLKFEFD